MIKVFVNRNKRSTFASRLLSEIDNIFNFSGLRFVSEALALDSFISSNN